MNLPFFIARRYFLSKRIPGVIHLISWVSLIGVTVGTAALIIVLSVFNGFEHLVLSLYQTFDADLKITAAQGKYFYLDEERMKELQAMEGVHFLTPVIEENVVLRYDNKQAIAKAKGVAPDFIFEKGLDSMVIMGSPEIEDKTRKFMLVGSGIASRLGTTYFKGMTAIQVYLPKKSVRSFYVNPEQAFHKKTILNGGIFGIQQDFDEKYVIVPIDFMRDLSQEEKGVTAIEIIATNGKNIKQLKANISELLGKDFKVSDRFEQHAALYKVFKFEKLAVFLILGFILLIAAFNLTGALIMLSIEKKKDLSVLVAMGARKSLIYRVVFLLGFILSFVGALVGMTLGAFICFLQIQYGFVTLPSEGGTFVLNAYPVAFRLWDFVAVFFMVLTLGFLVAGYPSRVAVKYLQK